MFETCPKKRMVIGISSLTLLTIIVLVVESQWAESPRQKVFRLEHNSTCYIKEDYEIIQDCHPCTAFEIASHTKDICVHTLYKEVLKCKSGETVTRSCDRVAWLDEKRFWTFEGILFVVGFMSTTLSIIRQKILDRKTSLKIQRQLQQTMFV